MKMWFKHPVSTIEGPISESEMVLRSSPPGYYHAYIAMRSIFWPTYSVTEHTDVGEGRTDSGNASITSYEGTPSAQVYNLRHLGDLRMMHKAWLINEVQKCAIPYDFHRWRTPPIPWRMSMFNTTGSLNQSSWSGTSSYTTYDVQDHLFWRILCWNQNHKVLCRAIGQGITLARG